MPDPCGMVEKCGFFKKHQQTKDLACRGFMALYCLGARQQDCRRRRYREEHGAPPPDDMMPNGASIAS